jgi:hypothetical protein
MIGFGFAIIWGIQNSIREVGAENNRKREARKARVPIEQLTPANDTGEGDSLEVQLAATDDLKERAVAWFIQTGETRRKAEKIVENGSRGFIPGGTFQQFLCRCIRHVELKRVKR